MNRLMYALHIEDKANKAKKTLQVNSMVSLVLIKDVRMYISHTISYWAQALADQSLHEEQEMAPMS